MATCFVIQPFDDGVFDRRYREVFKPAILDADVEPYRVDEDPSANIPVDQIEAGIRSSDVCFAEITTDNPNVWYELGYAVALGKQVVLVCSEERTSRFPFDVQHRKIIRYRAGSPSDFSELAGRLTRHLRAALQKEQTLEEFAELSPTKAQRGLTDAEVVTLAMIAQSMDGPENFIVAYSIKRDIERAGYTPLATALALRGLTRKNLVHGRQDLDLNGNDVYTYSVTESGMDWLEANQEHLVMRRDTKSKQVTSWDDDDLPF
jgi:hypothetical protein